MLKIGKYYLVPESEMELIQWWLHLLDRHRELERQNNQKEQEQAHEEIL